MAFRDLQNWFRSRFSGAVYDGTKRPDGGTSCYRPVSRRNPAEERAAYGMAADYAAGAGQTPYIHTGFTGMNPPASYTGGASAISTDPYGYGAAQAALRQATGGRAAENGYAFSARTRDGAAENGRQPVQQGYAGQEPAQGYTAWQAAPQQVQGYAPQPAFQASVPAEASPDNISYMPGVQAPDAGNAAGHVEHIMAMTSLRTCYEAIECMKNGETLIVTMDAIANESESTRCQDMLAGAAFTLGCSVRTIRGPGMVLIAPAGVKILPEQNSWSGPVMSYEMPVTPAAQPAPQYAGYAQQRRERRVSQNSAGWENARSEQNRNYNPYTGNMPAAAGSYASFGGYGY